MDKDLVPKKDLEALQSIAQWVEDKLGIFISDDKYDNLYFKLNDVCDKYNLYDLAALVERLNEDADSPAKLSVADVVSTNHTYFFREPDVLDFLINDILVNLRFDGPARIWSAASSTGDEAYTIAIMAAEKFGMSQLQEKVSILGTDISIQSILAAESGRYSNSHLRYAPEEWRRRYLSTLDNGRLQIANDIKKVCTFRRLNLMSDNWPFKRHFHIILCRNVLYYFKEERRIALINKLAEHVEPNGYLVTGLTESMPEIKERWEPVSNGIYRKRGNPC